MHKAFLPLAAVAALACLVAMSASLLTLQAVRKPPEQPWKVVPKQTPPKPARAPLVA